MHRRSRPTPFILLACALGCAVPIAQDDAERDASSSDDSGDDDATAASSTGGDGAGETEAGETEASGAGGEGAGGSSTGAPDGGDESTGAPSAEDDNPCLDNGNACHDRAPEGWSGPVVARPASANGDTVCTGAYAASVARGAADYTDPGFSCDCDCGTPEGGACSDNVLVRVYDTGACGAIGANAGGCFVQTAALYAGAPAGADTYHHQSQCYGTRFAAETPTLTSAPSCASETNHYYPPVDAVDPIELCSVTLPNEEGCDNDEQCVPPEDELPGDAICIWTEGDVGCPLTEYIHRQVIYTDVADTRSCSACGCGEAEDVHCDPADASLTVAATYNAGDGLVVGSPEPMDFAACTYAVSETQPTVAGTVFGFSYDPAEPTSSGCAPSGGAASGGVSPEQPITVCCNG